MGFWRASVSLPGKKRQTSYSQSLSAELGDFREDRKERRGFTVDAAVIIKINTAWMWEMTLPLHFLASGWEYQLHGSVINVCFGKLAEGMRQGVR